MDEKNIIKYLTERHNALSFINYAYMKAKKKVAKIIYQQLGFKCSLMALYYKFNSAIF